MYPKKPTATMRGSVYPKTLNSVALFLGTSTTPQPTVVYVTSCSVLW